MGRSFFLAISHRDVESTTYFMKEHGEQDVKDAAAYIIDATKEKRLKSHECKTCYYLRGGGMAGQSMWSWNCGVCGEDQLHHNTSTPKVCHKCCDQWGLCQRCGGDIEQRKRKQKWPELTKEQIEAIREKFK